MKSEINISQISYLSGYSKSTVSKAINNSKEISENTKLKIRKIAKEYGYKPNFSAKALKSKKTNSIGLIVPNFSKIFCAFIMEGIEEAAVKKGYKLVVYQSKNDLLNRKKVVKTLFDGSIDGLILITNERFAPQCEIDYVNKVVEDTLPTVKVDFSNCPEENGTPNQIKSRGGKIFEDLAKVI
ncbi:LacI family DNA-binding transcriptional regulator [Flagellimonas eckloniae]|uniref:LacI family DNA-binding transcriptional regulator n=1 Tax=Flagellimonas eckloniae TaxID=346185 RepID=UPI0009E89D15|nr:LacI family DNA-binding transcriptional regulator [Allomuricauda eckloniae]